MTEWEPIETAPKDGTLKLFWSPLGGCFIAPDVESEELPRSKVAQMIRDGADWPNVGWNPTHFMPLPEPPK